MYNRTASTLALVGEPKLWATQSITIDKSARHAAFCIQAKPPAEAFIGYGGVTVREAVRDGADWFVTDFGPLIEAVRGRESPQGRTASQQ